jgi:glycosyltransferase involved in cell wall biosynthesis
MCLMRSPRDTFDDPRTGSEVGWVRIVEGLRALGHTVHSLAPGDRGAIDWLLLDKPDAPQGLDVLISINEPDSLRDHRVTQPQPAPLHICEFWLNQFTFCAPEFDNYVDMYVSPSQAHLDQVLGAWQAQSPAKWIVNQLGCDPDIYPRVVKVPGRVVHCSSPDRGLHRLLEAWPHIKRAVPHATLLIFYQLDKWLRGFDDTGYFPAIEKNRGRALYVEEALKRLSGPEWGIEVLDSIDRVTLARELAQAEVMAYPCETISWSEGFSCSTLEACAAEACPIITDCDAFADVYRSLDPVPVGNWQDWRDRVILALTDAEFRREMNGRAKNLAEGLTWKRHVKQLETDILARLR